MAVVLTATTAADPTQANVVDVTGATPGAVFRLTREWDTEQEVISATMIADAGGAAHFEDFLYPLDTSFVYVLRDSTASTVVATSEPVGPVPSLGQPWIRDTVLPVSRTTSVRIVGVTPRRYPARVTPYAVIGQQYAVTMGDVRSGSEGTFTLFCFTHAERNRVIYTMSSGNPCSLRIPTACRDAIDEMQFTPLDINEVPFGSNGGNLLTVDFIEVAPSELPSFAAVTYGQQTTNAAAATMNYAELSAAFLGKTYTDLYYSDTGIAP